MARPKKIKSEIVEIEPSVEKSAVLVLSKKDSMDMMMDIVKSDYPEFDGDLAVVLGQRAIDYLYYRINGLVHHEAIMVNNLAPIEIEMWNKKPEFVSIVNVLKQTEAGLAESKLWRNVIDGDGTGLNSFFALKARKSEYKDNAQATGQTVTNVRISIDGSEFDVSASMKPREVEE